MDELASKYTEQTVLERNKSNESVKGLSQHKDVAVDFSPLES